MANPNPSPENRFKPGWKGGPGAPKGQRLTTRLLKAFDEKSLDDPFILAGIKAALQGDFNFWRHIFERIDGKLTENVNLTRDDSDEAKPRIEVPDVDIRSKGRKRTRKAKKAGSNGDVSS